MAPDDSPHIVTLLGSPPNDAIFSCIHMSAIRWSFSPRFVTPAACACLPPGKPRNPRRELILTAMIGILFCMLACTKYDMLDNGSLLDPYVKPPLSNQANTGK